MIDSLPPPSTYVHYENLSQDVSQSEYQKDLLVRALKEAIKGSWTYIDAGSLSAAVLNNKKEIKVKCIKCFSTNEKTEFVVNSVSFVSVPLKKELTFSTKQNGETNSWNFEVVDVEKTFGLMAKKSIQPQESLKPEFFEVISCRIAPGFQESSCFKSQDEALEKKKTVANYKLTKFVSSGKQVGAFDLQKPFLIKTNDRVRINFKSDSGLNITSSGRALGAGIIGQSVKVEILGLPQGNSKKNTIEATVQSAGEVTYER